MAIVTVSRLFGSGGSQVAAGVASRLGWTLYDNEVVDAVAARLRMTPVQVSAIEERVPSWVDRLATALSLSAPESLPPAAEGGLTPSEERIVEVTRRVIEEVVQRGSCVLVGRGAQCMLAERADALHVFCHAPRAALVRRSAEREGLSLEAAEHRVAEMNRQREQYVKKHWNRSWRDPQNYHLCVDTAWLGIDDAAELVARLAREKLGNA